MSNPSKVLQLLFLSLINLKELIEQLLGTRLSYLRAFRLYKGDKSRTQLQNSSSIKNLTRLGRT